MGFFNEMEKSKREAPAASLELLHRMGCTLCPLNCQATILKNPHMKATGAREPLIYVLGEAPGAQEDKTGKQFVGAAGDVLRLRIPREWLPSIRWNNVVRTRPPGNRDPTITEIEACRPSIIEDIERTKPRAIFGFGNVPLMWATGIPSGITKWSGRRIPIRVGNHTCWFFPIVHPSAILRGRRTNKDGEQFIPKDASQYGSNDEFAFALHVKRALQQVEDGLPNPIIHTPEYAKRDIKIIFGDNTDDLELIRKFLKKLMNEPDVGIDYETEDEHKEARPYHDGSKILSVALSAECGTAAIALNHPGARWDSGELEDIKDEFYNFLMEYKGRKLSHSLPFELEWSGFFFGKEVIHGGKWGCSLSQAYILDERQGANKLNDLCLMYFGLDIKGLSSLNRKRLADCNVEDVLLYNGIDSKYHRYLYHKQERELERVGMMDVYNHQLRRIPAIVKTQLKGVPVDPPTVKAFAKKYDKKIKDIEADLWELPEVEKFRDNKNRAFNPGSNPHVMAVMQRKGYNLDKVDEEELSKIDDVFCEMILEYRGLTKTKSTYIEPLSPGSTVLFPGNMLHPIISTTTVRTWRTASKEPNEQNFPKHGELREVRRQIQHKTKKIVTFDYAGIQARNVAMESLDKELIDAFWNDYDIHTDWMNVAIELFPSWVKEGSKALRLDKDLQKEYRQSSKNLFVFPSFFGAFPKSISASMGIPEAKIEKMQGRFFKRFPGIKTWQDKTRDNYERHGYVTGKSGFRRHAPVASTEIINTPIQSDEAKIVLGAMSRLSEKDDDRYQPIMEIHDDLTFLWDEKEIDRNAEIVAKEMTRIAFPWMSVVPIVVEMSIGDNWCDLKEVAKFSSVELWGHKRK